MSSAPPPPRRRSTPRWRARRPPRRCGATCRSPSAPRSCERFCAEFERRGADIAAEITWQIGRPIRFAPSEVRGTLERARYMIALRPPPRSPTSTPGAKAGLHALHPPRAAGRGVHRGRVELPLPDRRQQRRAGADGRQRRGAEAFGADAAVRRALRRGLARGRPARRGLPGAASAPRGHRARDRRSRASTSSPSPARSPAAMRCSGRRRALHRRRPRARRLRSGLRAPRRRPGSRHREHRRRRLLQLRPVLLRHPAHLCARERLRALHARLHRAHPAVPAGRSAAIQATTLGPVVRTAPRTRSARRSARPWPQARARRSTSARSRSAGPARPTSRRSCCSMPRPTRP